MIEMDERKRWSGCGNLLLIGLGGAGKSTLGAAVAPLLGLPMVDLDQEFSRRNGNIDAFIRTKGYQQYKLTNSELAEEVTLSTSSVLLVTSSGFLTTDNPEAALATNLRVLSASYSICLLPSRTLDKAVAIIVTRQLQRPFLRDRAREEEVALARVPLYAEAGDLVVFSDAAPRDVAQAVAIRLLSKPL
jgi:shikimate kinase